MSALTSVGEMSLGDHLEEIRSRLIRSMLLFMVCFIVGFFFQSDLKYIIELPLAWALDIAGEDLATKLGFTADTPNFHALSLQEPVMNSLKVSLIAAMTITIPFSIYQLWGFVTPALHNNEKKAGFLFVPAGIMFFYCGVLVGYLWGLPYFYFFLMEWTATSDIILVLRESYYISTFIMMTMAFGMVMNIPWLVMVLVFVGLVTPQQLSEKRKVVVMIAIVAAAMLTPPDPLTQLSMFIPMLVLFEIGLLASRFMTPKNQRFGNNPSGNDGDDDNDPDPTSSAVPPSPSEVKDVSAYITKNNPFGDGSAKDSDPDFDPDSPKDSGRQSGDDSGNNSRGNSDNDSGDDFDKPDE